MISKKTISVWQCVLFKYVHLQHLLYKNKKKWEYSDWPHPSMSGLTVFVDRFSEEKTNALNKLCQTNMRPLELAAVCLHHTTSRFDFFFADFEYKLIFSIKSLVNYSISHAVHCSEIAIKMSGRNTQQTKFASAKSWRKKSWSKIEKEKIIRFV